MPQDILGLVWALAAVVVVLVLAYWFTKYVAGRMLLSGGYRGRHITVLEQAVVGRDQKILLVKVGEEYYLLGASPNGITCLKEFTAEQAAQWGGPEEPPQQAGMSFRAALERVLEQRKKK